jgi:hypothetical protein
MQVLMKMTYLSETGKESSISAGDGCTTNLGSSLPNNLGKVSRAVALAIDRGFQNTGLAVIVVFYSVSFTFHP